MKAAIIGCGKIVENGHFQALERNKDLVTVAALADSSEKRLEFIGKKLSVPKEAWFTDYKKMLETMKFDVIDMALPHSLHKNVLIDCARSGTDIISEKPLTISLDEADEILFAVKENDVKLAVLHNYFHLPLYAKALEIVRSGRLGEMFLIRSESFGGSHYHSVPEYDPDWRTKRGIGGGGCLIDNGYHQIYFITEMMQSPVKSVFADVSTMYHPIDVEDTALLLLKHENGGSTSIQVGWSLKSEGANVQEYHGEKGSIYLQWGKDPVRVYWNETETWESVDCKYDMYESFLDSFEMSFREALTAFKNQQRPPASGAEARRNLEIINAAYESSREKRSVFV